MNDTWITLRTVSTEEEGTLMVGYLRSEGIEAMMDSRMFHQEPVPVGRLLNDVRIRVPAEQQEAAEGLLERADATASEDGDTDDDGEDAAADGGGEEPSP